MREIKFRVWLKQRDKMVYFDLFEPDRDYIIKEEASVREGDPVMQYTGLKDKNGKEIYEGDILEYYSMLVARGSNPIVRDVVKWKHYQWIGINNYNNAEVVGNIYENKV